MHIIVKQNHLAVIFTAAAEQESQKEYFAKERNTPKQKLISNDFLPVRDRIDIFAHNIWMKC